MKAYLRFIGISFLSVLLASGIEAKSVSEVVVDVKWGTEPGMVGIDESDPRVPALVPASIDIDEEGNIYIGDIVNRRINRYANDSEKDSITTIPLLNATGIFTVGKDGKIYTVCRYKISIYEKDGSFVKSYDFREAWKEWDFQHFVSPFIDTDNKGDPVLVSSSKQGDYVFEITFLDSTCELSPKKENLGRFRVLFPWVVIKRDEDGSIDLMNKANTKDSVIISSPQNSTYQFLGSDKKDNFYFYKAYGDLPTVHTKARIYTKVYKHDKTGELTDSTDILPLPCQHSRAGPAAPLFTQLDKDGNFYELIVTLSGVRVMKWSFQED